MAAKVKYKVRPPAGSLVLFPSNFLFVHGINPVKKKNRYALVNWIDPVPKSSFKEVVPKEFVSVKANGSSVRSAPAFWLGFAGIALTKELKKEFKLCPLKGVFVVEILAGSPADLAGLLPGDVVLSFDGSQVPTLGRISAHLLNALPRKEITLTIMRRRSEKVLKLDVQKRPFEIPPPAHSWV